jgi:hypothetical protein
MNLLNNLLPVILPPLMSACLAGLAAAYHLVKQSILARTPAALHSYMTQLASTIVSGIAQSMQGASGQQMKAAALSDAKAILGAMHLSIPDALMNQAIESAVLDLKQYAAVIQAQHTPVQPAAAVPAASATSN